MHDPALSTAQHRELIEALALSHVLPHDTLPVEECLGRRLAVDILSLIPLPPFTNSAMDGFAVRRDDLEGEGPWTLPVAGDIPAGDTRDNRLERGQAWRIMTGAPIPEGADTVVKVEDTDHAAGIAQAPDTVEIRVAPKPGENVRVAGEALGLVRATLFTYPSLAASPENVDEITEYVIKRHGERMKDIHLKA